MALSEGASAPALPTKTTLKIVGSNSGDNRKFQSAERVIVKPVSKFFSGDRPDVGVVSGLSVTPPLVHSPKDNEGLGQS